MEIKPSEFCENLSTENVKLFNTDNYKLYKNEMKENVKNLSKKLPQEFFINRQKFLGDFFERIIRSLIKEKCDDIFKLNNELIQEDFERSFIFHNRRNTMNSFNNNVLNNVRNYFNIINNELFNIIFSLRKFLNSLDINFGIFNDERKINSSTKEYTINGEIDVLTSNVICEVKYKNSSYGKDKLFIDSILKIFEILKQKNLLNENEDKEKLSELSKIKHNDDENILNLRSLIQLSIYLLHFHNINKPKKHAIYINLLSENFYVYKNIDSQKIIDFENEFIRKNSHLREINDKINKVNDKIEEVQYDICNFRENDLDKVDTLENDYTDLYYDFTDLEEKLNILEKNFSEKLNILEKNFSEKLNILEKNFNERLNRYYP